MQSPLHEMDDGEELQEPEETEETEAECTNSSLSMNVLACVVRQDIHSAIAPMQSQMNDLNQNLHMRLKHVE
jgi:hypothetical protein